MFERFTERARKVIILAREEAIRLGHNFVGTEHLLLGLIREGDGLAVAILKKLNVNIAAVKTEIEKIVAVGNEFSPGSEIPFTPQAKKVLEYAISEARSLGHNYIGTEHLLLGLIREGEGIGSLVLRDFGVSVAAAKAQAQELLGEQASKQTSTTRTPALDEFGVDLTALARQDKLDPVIGREAEIERVIQVLSRRKKNNPTASRRGSRPRSWPTSGSPPSAPSSAVSNGAGTSWRATGSPRGCRSSSASPARWSSSSRGGVSARRRRSGSASSTRSCRTTGSARARRSWRGPSARCRRGRSVPTRSASCAASAAPWRSGCASRPRWCSRCSCGATGTPRAPAPSSARRRPCGSTTACDGRRGAVLLTGKVALVTGAARGIGRATALVLAAEGADVGVVDRLPEVEATAEAIRTAGRRAAAAVFDVAEPAEVRAGVEALVRALGAIDVLVNNAGIVNNVAPLARMSHGAWERELAVNLSGAFNLIKEVVGPMAERGWGRIVNVSSIAALGGLHHQVGYAASKAGLLGLTKTVALEHARDGITCNAVLPGLIATELVTAMPAEIRESAVAATPARRLGETAEVAHLIAFLASGRAGFVNGVEIPVDGGMRLNTHSLASRREVGERRRP